MNADRVVNSWGVLALSSVVLLGGCPRPQVSALRVSPDSAQAIRKALGEEKSGAGGSAVEAAKPTGWATIRGKFTLDGAAPSARQLNIDKNQEVCAPGGKQVFAEELVVDSASKGIKDVVIFLNTKIPLDNPNWINPEYDAAKTAEVLFDQKQCVFLTHMFAARTSQKIVLKNSDPVGHNTKIDGKGSASVNVNMAANDSTSYVPGKESPQPFDVSCSVHTWMSAKMLIRDNPYFAVTKPDGTFEIKNVPAGVKLDFKVWQERLNFVQTVNRRSADGVKPEKWPRKGYSVTLQPDEVHEMDIIIPALTP